MNVSITDIGGLAGVHMTDYLNERGIRPIGLYNNSTVRLPELGNRANLFECAVHNIFFVHRLVEQHSSDMIYHVAPRGLMAALGGNTGHRPDRDHQLNACEGRQ